MPTNLTVDLDDIALRMRGLLDTCNVHVWAIGNPESINKMDYRLGVTTAIEVHAMTELVLDNLRPSDVDNRERFMALNQEANRLTKLFWKQYNISLKGTSPAPQPVAVAPKVEPRPVRKNEEPQQEVSFARLPPETVKLLHELFDVVGTSASTKDIEEIAREANVKFKTASTRYYRWRNNQKG